MIPSTSVILIATVVLNALNGMGAPIKVTRAIAEAHQPGRRQPQPAPIAPEPEKKRFVPESSTMINRRFPRRAHYEKYIREVTELANREPVPEPVAEPVVERAAVNADAAPHRRHSRRSQKTARSTPATKNLAQRRNSKVGGSQRRSTTTPKADESVAKRSSETKAEAPAKKRSTKVVAKKRSNKAKSSISKKRSIKGKAPVVKKRSTTKATKRNGSKQTQQKKRSTKDKNVKRNNKTKNLKKRSPAAATTPNKVQLRALDVPSEHLEARHYKIIKIKSSGGCQQKKPECSCCKCSCCGCQGGQQSPGPVTTLPTTDPSTGNSTVPVPDPKAGTQTPPIIPDPAAVPPVTPGSPAPGSPAPAAGSPPPVPTSTVPATGSTDPAAAPPGAGVTSPSPSAVPVPKPKVPKRQLLKNRSPRMSADGPNRRSSRNKSRSTRYRR